MDPLNVSWYEDDLESQNWSQPFNGSGREPDRPPYNYFAMSLALLIFVIIFGNVLVCMAVSREKALQTTTNYLIVSLAVADLLVATLVMPWVVYLEVGVAPPSRSSSGGRCCARRLASSLDTLWQPLPPLGPSFLLINGWTVSLPSATPHAGSWLYSPAPRGPHSSLRTSALQMVSR